VSGFDLAVGIDVTSANEASAAVYRQLYPQLFKGSTHVAKEGLEFDVLWDVKAPPTVDFVPPPEPEAIVRDHLAAIEPPPGVTPEQLTEAYIETLTDTVFQLKMDQVTMTIKGDGGEGTDEITVTIFVAVESVGGALDLRPLKAIGTTDNVSDEWFLNHAILPEAMRLAAEGLRGIKLPALTFSGVALTPPAIKITPRHAIAIANLDGRPIPTPPFPDEWPQSRFFAVMSDYAKLRVAQVATRGIPGTRYGKSGSVDIGVGTASYEASAVVDAIDIGMAGGTEFGFRGRIRGNVNAGVKVGCTTFGVNYTLHTTPDPIGRIDLSIRGTTVHAATTPPLNPFILVITPNGSPAEWLLSALTAPLLQILAIAFSPLITRTFEGIGFDVWTIPSIPIEFRNVHLALTPTDVHFSSFGGQTAIEGTARIG
jgi:hypothetical protein